MIKVITYGTFDLLHQGHINLLKRAKALGDCLYVGVTTNNFDLTRGKLNVSQSLMERIEAVKATNIADEVFPEEYVGQKIDDIKRNDINIFAIGSDWEGKFDYLKEYCQVVYLPRTEGISSTQLRSNLSIKIGTVGSDPTMEKLARVSKLIDGVEMGKAFIDETYEINDSLYSEKYDSFISLLKDVNAVYVASRPDKRYDYIKQALLNKKHVICSSPIALSEKQCLELLTLAKENNLQLFDSIKTAYLLSFSRLFLLIKSGIIGDVKAIDATCTSLEYFDWMVKTNYSTSLWEWGPIALLPIFKILGLNYKNITLKSIDSETMKNAFTKINLEYEGALATVNLGLGVKSESDLRICGTKGYIYIPSPWWKSEYFEARFENRQLDKPYYYKSDNEGLSMELFHFVQCIKTGKHNFYMEDDITKAISKIMEMLK